VAQSKWTGSTESVASQQGYGWVGEVQNGVQHRVEAIGIGEGVAVRLIKLETCVVACQHGYFLGEE